MIELIVVMAIIVLLVAISAPSIIEVASGQGMKRAVGDVSGIIEQARIEAMAKNTWTWVGFSQQDAGGNQPELVAVLMASKDGTTNMATGNLRILQRPVRMKNVKILALKTHWAPDDGTIPLAGSDFGFVETVLGKAVTFTNSVLGFTPQGEASVAFDSVPPWVEVGLREMRGSTEITNKTASVRVSGFSGQVNIDY